MTQRYTMQVLDDLDGREGAQTVRFGLDGKAYEIDLAEDNLAAFRGLLEPYVSVARRADLTKRVHSASRLRRSGPKVSALPQTETPSGGTAEGTGPKVTAVKGTDIPAIREWANAHGYAVGARGRIPNEIQGAYLQAVKGK